MRITRIDFEKQIPASHLPTDDIKIGKILYRVHRYYCTPLTLKGRCPGDCSKCNQLTKVFKKLHQSKDVIKRHALLVWLLRTAVANIAEKDEAPRVKAEKDWLGMEVESNAASFRKTLLNVGVDQNA